MSNVNKAIYGPAALVIAEVVINWLRSQGLEISDDLANLVIKPVVVGLVVWTVPNGISLADYLHRIARKGLGRIEKEMDEPPTESAQ